MIDTRPISGEESQRFYRALLASDRFTARQVIEGCLGQAGPLSVVEQLVVPTLEQIGDQWDSGALSLSQVYMSGRICEGLVDELMPPTTLARVSQPPIAIAVLEDYHLLGKRMVAAALRASGVELHDYGRVDLDGLVARVAADQIAILLISVLMLPSALRVKELRQRLGLAGLRPTIIVGGAPFRFDEQLWRAVDADGMGRTSSDAVALVGRLIKERT